MVRVGKVIFAVWSLAAFLGHFLIPQPALAQYPSEPIDLIVPFAPGGSSDSTARLIAPILSKKWNQPVNVVNKPGGSAILGTNHVMQAKPDGYTILLDSHAVNAMLAASRSDLPFKWDQRTPIARLYLEPVVYAVKKDAPWKTLREVIAAAKANPQNFKWGSAGVGAIGTFSVSELLHVSGINVKSTNQVIFAGGAPTLTALAGGHVSLAGQQISDSLPMISGDMIRGVALVLSQRAPQIPDVPTAKEAGFPALQTCGWTAISGPRNLPQEIVNKWVSALKEAMNDPELAKKAQNLGKFSAFLNASEFKKYMLDQYNTYLPLAEAAGIRK